MGSATSGTVPVDTNSPYTSGATVTVLANSGTLAQSGATFAGWNTQANGTGTTYQAGTTFTITNNTELFPLFTPNSATYSVTYEMGSATSGTVPVDTNSPYTSGATVTVLANSGTLAQSGATFAGWNTQANGTGTTYQAGTTFTITNNTELFPLFTPNALKITTSSLASASPGQTNYARRCKVRAAPPPTPGRSVSGSCPRG